MQHLIQICKVTITVFLIAMVAVLFSTLTGCRGCTSEEEVVRWVPTSRDTIPEVAEVDSLELESTAGEIIVEEIIRPAKKARAATKPKEVDVKETCPETYPYDTNIRPWSDAPDLDSIELTIVVSDIEMQITQNLN